MSTWFFEGATSVLLFVVLVPVLTGPLLAVVYRRYRYPAPLPTLLAAATALYGCALVAFTTFPLPSNIQRYCRLRTVNDYRQLVPFHSLDAVLRRYEAVGLAATLGSTTFLQVAFNVAFFVPLGVLVAYYARRGVGLASTAGVLVSLVIETTQGTGLWGLYPCPYRVADVDDVLTNTLGAAIGWLVGVGLRRVWPFERLASRVDLDPPTGRRRVAAAFVDVSLVALVGAGSSVVLALFAVVRGEKYSSMQTIFDAVQVMIGVFVFLVVPMVRADRATVGQVAVLLGLRRLAVAAPASRWSVVARFGVRWLPVIVWGVVALGVVAAVELGTIWARKDNRSLSSVLARTVTRTRDDIERRDAVAPRLLKTR